VLPWLLLLRLLELTGAKEPAALEKLVKAVGVKPASVNKDLLLYKGVLSKLSSAKVRRAQGCMGVRRETCWPCLCGVVVVVRRRRNFLKGAAGRTTALPLYSCQEW
jgi:hypothetical protein